MSPTTHIRDTSDEPESNLKALSCSSCSSSAAPLHAARRRHRHHHHHHRHRPAATTAAAAASAGRAVRSASLLPGKRVHRPSTCTSRDSNRDVMRRRLVSLRPDLRELCCWQALEVMRRGRSKRARVRSGGTARPSSHPRPTHLAFPRPVRTRILLDIAAWYLPPLFSSRSGWGGADSALAGAPCTRASARPRRLARPPPLVSHAHRVVERRAL